MLSISLAKPDGRVFGGGVAGSLIAAGPIQVGFPIHKAFTRCLCLLSTICCLQNTEFKDL